jgi:hypothetical protein
MSHLGRRRVNSSIRAFLREDRGSISILIFGLFVVLLSTALVLTDISSVYLAKRSLTQATEAAVQRGLKNLDAESYYSGEYNALQFARNLLGSGEEDPGIPIDCQAGLRDTQEILNDWQSTNSSRVNLDQIQLRDYQCDGFQINIETAAIARIPIPLPFIRFDGISIHSHAGGIGERADTNNFSGFDIG